ncbi:MAG TPA: type II toxin-antitoxin system HicB family antitoxin [Candidatus Paceibacterota bacterium]
MRKTLRKKISRRYTAIFESDKEAGGFTVTIPALPGCISEGNTFEEAFENIREAASLYLETMKGKEKIPDEDSGVLIVPIQVKV